MLPWKDSFASGLGEVVVTETTSGTMTSAETTAENGANKRRSTRLVHMTPITVNGTDALGKPFRDVTKTLVVSCYGCAFPSRMYAPKKSEVTLEISRGHSWLAPRKVTAKVVWVQRPQKLREQYQIAVALDVPGNVWGIDAPPEDWFPHPEDVVRAAAVAEPSPEPAVEEKPAESETTADEAETLVVADAAVAAVVEREIEEEIEKAELVEEIVYTREHLDAGLEDALQSTLRTMIERAATQAVRDFARETAERAMAVIEEVRQNSEALAEELDAKIRAALDEAVNATVAGPLEKPRKKKMKLGRSKI